MTTFNAARRPDFRAGREALSYDGYWERRGLSIQKKLLERETVMLARVSSQSSVLVVGCGTSRLPIALRDKGCMVTVSDISPEAVALFTKEGMQGFVFDLEGFEDSDIPQSYDVVIASEVLEHIRNPERAVELLSKHTKRFMLTIPNTGFYRYRIHLMFAGRFPVQWAHHPAEHLRYWTHIDFLDWCAAMDLHVEATIASNGLSCKGLCGFAKDWWPNLFGHQIVYDCTVKKVERASARQQSS